MSRIVLGIEYDGTEFAGWQFQHELRTVQGELEKALSKVANQPVTVRCTGRTDSGVHALEQVVHFDTEVTRELNSWVMGGNVNLPEDVRIIWAQHAVDDFHARYSAIARFYRYIILNREMKSALARKQVTWCFDPLDEVKMHQAAQTLVGMHDFSSFRAKGCQSVSPNRLMYFINVYRQGENVVIDMSANAFVHHMVRNIAGVLMAIGKGDKPVSWTKQLLEIKDRQQSGVTAPPYGLYLGGVYYPEKYGLKKNPVFDALPTDAKRFEY